MTRNPKRKTAWKMLIREHSNSFLQWMDSNQIAFRCFDSLATDIDKYLLNRLLRWQYAEIDEQQFLLKFVSAIPEVLAHCDENIYDGLLVADAYAYVHLLERYRRFWAVLVELTKHGLLPMRDTGINVLDVGAGPGPTVFAVKDYYQALREYATDADIPVLQTPLPRVDTVESSDAMVHVVHELAEYRRDAGPFRAEFRDFYDLDFDIARSAYRIKLESEYDYELGWEGFPVPEGEWKGRYNYNLAVFSNFLTQPSAVVGLEKSIRRIFAGLRAGGVVVVLGGTQAHYPQIYAMVARLARQSGVQVMTRIPEHIPVSYSDDFAKRVKQSYLNLWQYLEQHFIELKPHKLAEYTDIWDPDVPLAGPKNFGVRVFRKVWATQWHRIQYVRMKKPAMLD